MGNELMKYENKVLKIKDEKPFEEMQLILLDLENQKTENHILLAVYKANAISQLKSRMPLEFVKSIRASLEGTAIGYKVDRPNPRDRSVYTDEEVRNCYIEALMKGVYLSGNEFNIMAGNCYITKEGFTGKMQRNNLFSEVKLDFGIPENDIENKLSIVECSATWKYNGVPDSLHTKIPIKFYSTDSADQTLGKANRKLRARIWEQATGNYIADGEIETMENGVAKRKSNNLIDEIEQAEIIDANNEIKETLLIMSPTTDLKPVEAVVMPHTEQEQIERQKILDEINAKREAEEMFSDKKPKR